MAPTSRQTCNGYDNHSRNQIVEKLMSAPPPKPPKPPPKPSKPEKCAITEENEKTACGHATDLNPTTLPPRMPSTASKQTSIKIDEALKESMQSLSKTVFSGRDIGNANLFDESIKYKQDTVEEVEVAVRRLQKLNDLFKLSLDYLSTKRSGSSKHSCAKAPLTGSLIREGYMTKKSRKSDDKVYGILTSEYFAYGNEEFHVTGPSTMVMRRILPLTTTLITSNATVSSNVVQKAQELSEDDVLRGKTNDVTNDQENERAKSDMLSQCSILSKDKSFALQFLTKEERQEWYGDISTACSAAQHVSGRVYDPSEMSPVWQQDKTTSKCDVCFKGFSFFFRKHHCRNCGKCVCENCLVEKIRIPSLDPRALFKVCSACSMKLKEERNYMR